MIIKAKMKTKDGRESEFDLTEKEIIEAILDKIHPVEKVVIDRESIELRCIPNNVAQIRVDVAYSDYEELDSFYNAIHNINEDNEFKVDIIGNQTLDNSVEDMTEHYERQGMLKC